jgi:UDP-N-acetylglucosamine 2-epimerase (non-hydrolysing)
MPLPKSQWRPPSAKVLIAFGTRPEVIKLFPVIAALKAEPRFRVRLCATGQHRELLDPVLALTEIEPDHDLQVMRPGQGLTALSAALLSGLGQVIAAEQPDRVLVQGDTATAFCATLAAYYNRVPVDHIEAGLRSGSNAHPWPEEGHRKAIAALASLHFAPTITAASALQAECIDPARIHITGNTVIDALHWITARIVAEPQLVSGLDRVVARFAGRRIIGVTCHRREALYGDRLAGIATALRQIAARDDVALIFPLHPQPEVRAVMAQTLAGLGNVALIAPLDYPHFVRLLGLSTLLLSDSGGMQEEAPALGTPVLVMRETTERPEAVIAGGARLVGTDPARIVRETCALLDDSALYARMAQPRTPFGDGQAAQRIVARLTQAIWP